MVIFVFQRSGCTSWPWNLSFHTQSCSFGSTREKCPNRGMFQLWVPQMFGLVWCLEVAERPHGWQLDGALWKEGYVLFPELVITEWGEKLIWRETVGSFSEGLHLRHLGSLGLDSLQEMHSINILKFIIVQSNLVNLPNHLTTGYDQSVNPY